ncbi:MULTISPECIES: 1-phosphofructokinase family hexose kinase [unclassified Listeria]|uniref:1-phosphofructokinase family hexose kinase n=1 Tax=unclassified Listeria TaxID=2642072 RepID=UPI000B58F025|nr:MULTISPECIES: 1-phosphofructokinase family hexose kinase [unclassified Listeria]
MIYTITLNPAIDRLLFIREELEKRKTNRVVHTEFDCGGKGLHVSHVLSQYEIPNVALGFIGEQNQAQLFDILKKRAISHHFFVEPDVATRECFVVISETTSGSTMMPEAGFTVSEKNKENLLHFIKENVKKSDYVVIAGSPPPGYALADFKTLFSTVKKTGAFLACDLSGEFLLYAAKNGVDFLKPNEEEVKILVHQSNDDLLQNIRVLMGKIRYFVVSLGKKGSYVAYNGKVYRVLAPQVIEKSDTGAGDAFVGGFIAGLSANLTIENVIRRASSVAASKVQYMDSATFSVEEAAHLSKKISIIEVEEM